jgi:hypothetical protein
MSDIHIHVNEAEAPAEPTLKELTVLATKAQFDNSGGPGLHPAPSNANNSGGVGLGNRTSPSNTAASDEANKILSLVTSESSDMAQKAKAIVLDHKASPEAKRIALHVCKSEVQNALKGEELDPMPASNDATDIGAVAKLRKEADDETDPVLKEELGSKATLAGLKLLASRGRKERAVKARELAKSDTPEIAKLRELSKSENMSPELRQQVGNVLTMHDLKKSAVEDEQNATIALIQRTQANVTHAPATLGRSGLSPLPIMHDGPRDQVANIGSGNGMPERLAPAGRIEPEPAAVLATRENELAEVQKSGKARPDQIARLGEEITKLRLLKAHGA